MHIQTLPKKYTHKHKQTAQHKDIQNHNVIEASTHKTEKQKQKQKTEKSHIHRFRQTHINTSLYTQKHNPPM